MIKVEHTRLHEIVTYGNADTPPKNSVVKAEGKVLVTDAKLVLINPGQYIFNSLTSHGRLVIDFKEPNSIQTAGGSWWKMSGTKFFGVPILISETGKIEEGDWYLNMQNQPYINRSGDTRFDGLYDKCYKILALPEHFSPEQLKMIVDVKLKDGDKVLVECNGILEDGDDPIIGEFIHKGRFEIKRTFYVTFHKVEEYTEREISIYNDGYRDGSRDHMVTRKMYTFEDMNELRSRAIGFGASGLSLNKWFEENVKQ